jgi:hypothetical protein
MGILSVDRTSETAKDSETENTIGLSASLQANNRNVNNNIKTFAFIL